MNRILSSVVICRAVDAWKRNQLNMRSWMSTRQRMAIALTSSYILFILFHTVIGRGHVKVNDVFFIIKRDRNHPVGILYRIV